MELTLIPVYINGKRYLSIEDDETLNTIVNAINQSRKYNERYQAKNIV